MLKRKGPQSAGIAALTLALVFTVMPGGVRSAKAQGSSDSQIQADVQKALNKKQYKDIHATVHNGEVTLQGSVDVYADKESADNRVQHVKNIKGVDNLIGVAGSKLEDVALRNKLANRLATDRVGYGTTAFNSISVGVHDGVVTLAGTVYGPVDKDSALSLVANTAGVKDIIDNLDVAPLSPMDDQLRVRLANAIYGTMQLEKYALDPAKPIRITVINGNVTLTGVVDSKADRDIAGIRANSVSGVFKVTNDLQVAGTHPGK